MAIGYIDESIKKFVADKLHHSVTNLANKGAGVRVLAKLAGHSSISTTQRYIDVNAEQLSSAVEFL